MKSILVAIIGLVSLMNTAYAQMVSLQIGIFNQNYAEKASAGANEKCSEYVLFSVDQSIINSLGSAFSMTLYPDQRGMKGHVSTTILRDKAAAANIFVCPPVVKKLPAQELPINFSFNNEHGGAKAKGTVTLRYIDGGHLQYNVKYDSNDGVTNNIDQDTIGILGQTELSFICKGSVS